MLTFLLSLIISIPPSPPAESVVKATEQMTLRGEWDAAIARLEPAIEIAVAERDRTEEAILRAELGRVLADRSFFHRADAPRACKALQRALRTAREARHEPSIAAVTMAIGQMRYSEAFRTKDWETPRTYFRHVESIRTRLGDRRGLAQTYFYLGLTYEQEGKPERAEPLYRRSLALAEAVGDKVQQSYAHRHIGGLYEERRDADNALRHISQSVALRRQGGFAVGVPYALIQLADFLSQHQGKLDEAMRLLEEAIDLAEAAHSTRAQSAAQSSLARLALVKHDAPQAVSFLRCALDNARTYGDREAVEEAERALEGARSGQ